MGIWVPARWGLGGSNISARENMKRARPRRGPNSIHLYLVGVALPFRATPDTPPLAAAMLCTIRPAFAGRSEGVRVVGWGGCDCVAWVRRGVGLGRVDVGEVGMGDPKTATG